MKARFLLILLSLIAFIFVGAFVFAQDDTDATDDGAGEAEEATEAEPEAEEATEAEPEAEETTEAEPEAEETTEAEPEAMEAPSGFVKAELVDVKSANNYRVIINGEEMSVGLMGLDFYLSNSYLFDQRHNEYAEWLLVGYEEIWVDYDPERTDSYGRPLVYLYYGPFDTELWEQSPITADVVAQTNDVYPPKPNYYGPTLEIYDEAVAEPYMNDPEFSSVDANWAPNYEPKKFGKEYVETYTSPYGKERTRKWYLRDLNRFMLLSGFADVDKGAEFDRKAEFSDFVAKAKWCRRGVWQILLDPRPTNEDVCGIESIN